MAMDQLGITNEPNNVFEFLRSSTKGIIDCIRNDFSNFFPTHTIRDIRFRAYKPIISEHFAFFHYDDFQDKRILIILREK